jgi:integrase/recombinase XerD
MKTPSFAPIRNKHAGPPWLINIPARFSPSGKRERRFFDTEKDAKLYGKGERLRVEREGHHKGAEVTAAQREVAAAAFRLLEGHAPQKLIEIVEAWISKRKMASESVSVEQAFTQYIARGKKRKGRGGMAAFVPFSAKHKRGIEYAQEALEAHKESKIASLAAEDISKALAGFSASYHNAHLRIIRAVCEYAVEKKWAAENVAEEVEMKAKAAKAAKAKTSATETPILTIEQASRLLQVADEAAPQFVPFLALTLFAGIRPDLESGEILELTWDMVQLKDKRLIIPSEVSKTESRRVIEMEDALVEWLEYYIAKRCAAEGIKEVTGEIVPKTNLRQRMRLVRELAGVEWEQDIARHSFASYHLSHFENLARCVESMGHRDSAMLWKHYKASIPKDTAAKYWEITPRALGLD